MCLEGLGIFTAISLLRNVMRYENREAHTLNLFSIRGEIEFSSGNNEIGPHC